MYRLLANHSYDLPSKEGEKKHVTLQIRDISPLKNSATTIRSRFLDELPKGQIFRGGLRQTLKTREDTVSNRSAFFRRKLWNFVVRFRSEMGDGFQLRVK